MLPGSGNLWGWLRQAGDTNTTNPARYTTDHFRPSRVRSPALRKTVSATYMYQYNSFMPIGPHAAVADVRMDQVAPVANAGPGQTVTIGTTVTLNGSGSSDADGNPLTYLWSFVSIPAGSGATLTRPHDGQTNFPGGQNRSVRRPTHRQRRRSQQHSCDSDDYHHTG